MKSLNPLTDGRCASFGGQRARRASHRLSWRISSETLTLAGWLAWKDTDREFASPMTHASRMELGIFADSRRTVVRVGRLLSSMR